MDPSCSQIELTEFIVGRLQGRLRLTETGEREAHLPDLPNGHRYGVFAGGLAPRLSPTQMRSGPILVSPHRPRIMAQHFLR
jgi:hypothetical protein